MYHLSLNYQLHDVHRTKSSPASSPPLGTRARRSNSLGSEVRSRTGSTRKRRGLALQDQTLPETEEERQGKRSVELLHVKELSFPSPTESAASPKPAPIQIVQPPTPTENLPPSPSPASPTPRAIKAQSTYNPITTTGLWDSGVVDGPGIKKRPTSMVIVNQKMEKAKRKEQRSKSKEKRHLEMEKECQKRSERLKQRFLNLFRKGKR